MAEQRTSGQTTLAAAPGERDRQAFQMALDILSDPRNAWMGVGFGMAGGVPKAGKGIQDLVGNLAKRVRNNELDELINIRQYYPSRYYLPSRGNYREGSPLRQSYEQYLDPNYSNIADDLSKQFLSKIVEDPQSPIAALLGRKVGSAVWDPVHNQINPLAPDSFALQLRGKQHGGVYPTLAEAAALARYTDLKFGETLRRRLTDEKYKELMELARIGFGAQE